MFIQLLRDRHGAAAAEMALVMPLLLFIMLGSTELGNYFMNEHSLIKAVRDGARFAARQGFGNYPTCTGSPDTTNVVTPTQNVVMYGYLSGTQVLTPNITAADVTVTTNCTTSAGGQNMSGIYKDLSNGAQTVTVRASVTYRPIIATAFGISSFTTVLNAKSQAAVTGL